MTSKRNSRLYIDDVTHQKHGHQHSTETYRSRRNSHTYTKENLLQTTKQTEEEGLMNGPPFIKAVSASLPQTNESSEKETPMTTVLPRVGQMAVPAALGLSMASSTSPSFEYPPAPLEGRPHNFGVVIPGVYRSSYPKADDYGFLQGLKLKTVVTLVKRDEIDHDFESFVTANGIRQVVFNMKGTKKEAIPNSTMSSILHLVLDQRNYPLLLHCNHGKHRTGCVIAVVRKLSGWDLNRVVDEYKTYAAPKIRECDVDYITSFESTTLDLPSIRTLDDDSPRLTSVQARSFLRTLLFSTFVLIVWLVSGSRIATSKDRISN